MTTQAEQVFGYDVYGSDEDKIGSVDSVWVDDATNELEFIGVKTGWLGGKNHVIPVANAQIADGSITVPFAQSQIKDAPSFSGDDALSPENENEIYSYYGLDRSTAPSPTGLPTGGTDYATSGTGTTGYDSTATGDISGTDQQEVTLSEEELAVGKREVQAGGVRLRKVVRSEHQEVPVELRREEVQIERIPASEASVAPSDAFQEEEIEVPVSREEAVVEKQARVTGGVRVNKNVETETQTVGGEVRSEDVEVDDTRSATTTDFNRR